MPLGFKVCEFTNHSLFVLFFFHVSTRSWNCVASDGSMNSGSDGSMNSGSDGSMNNVSDGKASGRRLFAVAFSDLSLSTE